MKAAEDQTDEELAVLTRTKNKELYSSIVHRYQKKLFRYAAYLLQNDSDAADIVQDAFIKAYVNLNSFDAKKKFSSWIYRIVHNEAMNFIKKRKRVTNLTTSEWEDLPDETEEHIEDLFRRDRQAAIKQSLKQLPETYREVLILYYLEEKSYYEIAEILGQPVSTVGTNILRAKKQLRIVHTAEDE